MRLRHLQHAGAERRQVQPMRHLMLQHPVADRDRPVIWALLALAGNDQHQPQPVIPGVENEADQFRMRLGHGHAMQVKPRLGRKLAADHAVMVLAVHQHRGGGQTFGQRGQGVQHRRLALAFADAEAVQLGFRRRGQDLGLMKRRHGVGIGQLAMQRRRVHRLGRAGDGLPKLSLFGAQGTTAGHDDQPSGSMA